MTRPCPLRGGESTLPPRWGLRSPAAIELISYVCVQHWGPRASGRRRGTSRLSSSTRDEGVDTETRAQASIDAATFGREASAVRRRRSGNRPSGLALATCAAVPWWTAQPCGRRYGARWLALAASRSWSSATRGRAREVRGGARRTAVEVDESAVRADCPGSGARLRKTRCVGTGPASAALRRASRRPRATGTCRRRTATSAGHRECCRVTVDTVTASSASSCTQVNTGRTDEPMGR